jgi:hypothetical protein
MEFTGAPSITGIHARAGKAARASAKTRAPRRWRGMKMASVGNRRKLRKPV